MELDIHSVMLLRNVLMYLSCRDSITSIDSSGFLYLKTSVTHQLFAAAKI